MLAVAIALVRSLLCALVALCASCPRSILLRATMDYSRDFSQPGVVFAVYATCPRSVVLRAVMYLSRDCSHCALVSVGMYCDPLVPVGLPWDPSLWRATCPRPPCGICRARYLSPVYIAPCSYGPPSALLAVSRALIRYVACPLAPAGFSWVSSLRRASASAPKRSLPCSLLILGLHCSVQL